MMASYVTSTLVGMSSIIFFASIATDFPLLVISGGWRRKWVGGTEWENLSPQCNDDHNYSSRLDMAVASSCWTTPVNLYFMCHSSMKNVQLWSFFKIRSSLTTWSWKSYSYPKLRCDQDKVAELKGLVHEMMPTASPPGYLTALHDDRRTVEIVHRNRLEAMDKDRRHEYEKLAQDLVVRSSAKQPYSLNSIYWQELKETYRSTTTLRNTEPADEMEGVMSMKSFCTNQIIV